MKNKNKILILFIVAVVISFFVIKNYCIKKSIKEEYISLMDAKLENFIEEEEYARQADVKEISYKIKKIKEYDDEYMIEVEAYLICNRDSLDFDAQMAAYGLADKFKNYDLEINGYECTHRCIKYNGYYSEDLITVYINDEKFIYPKRKDEKKKESALERSSKICRVSGCGKQAKYSDWDRKYCEEHLQGTKYCRHPGCNKEIPILGLSDYCSSHD